jgi:AcrR family transcriptional regulator
MKTADRHDSVDIAHTAGESGRGAAAADGVRLARAAARRDAILKAALKEFSARGFAATRIDDVAHTAGVAKGTIYLYFSDKETLFQELIRQNLTPVMGAFATGLASDVSLAAFADQAIEIFVREIYETDRKEILRLMINEGPRFSSLAEFYYREVLAPIFAVFRARMSRARERGEIDSDVLIRFPQLLGAASLVAILWQSLFERFEPLDVRALLRGYFDILLAERPRSP